jgi:uncharacterized OB-fold protein
VIDPADDPVLQPQPVGVPAPVPSALSQPYWDGAARGELLYQRCDACGTIAGLPAPVCGACLGRALTWTRSSGTGSLYSWTVVWRPQHPSFAVPYAPAIVELDEGWTMMSSVVGCRPSELVAGLRLAVEFHPVSEDISLPYVRPR